ncbi:MAG: hypothetical protein FD180_4702 [Planctomycetota bacterium]|nr:MAG: hypothetical protein FD180_4702 [Planctomycetota bacterium]
MKRALAIALLAALPAPALTVELESLGFDKFMRRGRPTPAVVRVASESAFHGDFSLEGGTVTRVFPIDLPARGSIELRTAFVFYGSPEIHWRAGAETGTLKLDSQEPLPGEALVASEREAVGRRADKYKMDFPPGTRFFFAEFPRDATPELFAAVDAVVLKRREEPLPGLAAFRARGGAILWVGEAGKEWEGRVDPRDDLSWGEDAYAVLERPAWAAGPRPYLARLFGFALAPVLLAALAGALVPGSVRLRGGVAAALLGAGAALAPLAAPATLALRETYAIEFLRGREADRLEISAGTLPAKGASSIAFAAGAVPEPIFFSRRDAMERRVTVRHEAGGFVLSAGPAAAGSTLAIVRVTHREIPGALGADGEAAVNETARDLQGAFIVEKGRAGWIGDLPAGSSRVAEGSLRMSDVRSKLGATPWRRMMELWWRRANHDGRYLVGFAEEESSAEGIAAVRRNLGVMVVVELKRK